MPASLHQQVSAQVRDARNDLIVSGTFAAFTAGCLIAGTGNHRGESALCFVLAWLAASSTRRIRTGRATLRIIRDHPEIARLREEPADPGIRDAHL